MEIKYLKDEFDECDLKYIQKDNIIKGISNYETGCYEGNGYFIALGEDGFWRKYECGHCSCYGPLESGYTGKFTQEEIYKIMSEEKISPYYYTKNDKREILEFILNS